MPSSFIITDGIIAWFNGPEWDDVVREAFKEFAPKIESVAKADAPWEDQSGDARAGLFTAVDDDPEGIELSLNHTVEYGFWLEVIQNGNFAIIMPTLEGYSAELMAFTADKIIRARKGRTL